MSAAETLIEEVRRLDAAATPGPWWVHERLGGGMVMASVGPHGSSQVALACGEAAQESEGETTGDMMARNGDLIARFRTLAPQLAAELEATAAALREERQNAEGLAREARRECLRAEAAESRAKAAEERVAELESDQAEDAAILREIRDTLRNAGIPSTIAALRAALEPLADMRLFSEHHAIGAITADQVRAARRALGRPE